MTIYLTVAFIISYFIISIFTIVLVPFTKCVNNIQSIILVAQRRCQFFRRGGNVTDTLIPPVYLRKLVFYINPMF